MRLGGIRLPHRHYSNGLDIPSDWESCKHFLLLSGILLVVSAVLSGIKLSEIPKNPLYWHLWLIMNVKVNSKPPYEDDIPILRLFSIISWAASILYMFCAMIILAKIFYQ
jgi:hypothetical protein